MCSLCGNPSHAASGAAASGETSAGQTPLETGIDWGTQIGHAAITYYFEPGGQFFDEESPISPVTSVDFVAYEKQQFAAAFATIETFINVTFTEVFSEGAADFKLIMYSPAMPSNNLGAFGPPGTGDSAGFGIFNQAGKGWQEDVTDGTGALEQGGFGFVTILHELGHGLGLAHPHDGGGTSTVFPGVGSSSDPGDFSLNQGVYTTMSYIDGWITDPDGEPPTYGPYGFQGTMMGIDTAVLQSKYGANVGYHAGDDVYVLPDVNDVGTFFGCIWDAGGTDWMIYGGIAATTIDLRQTSLLVAKGGGGFISYAHGIFGGYTIARGALIENAQGGLGNDLIYGNGVANAIVGSYGADTVFAGAGLDIVTGGPGNDILRGGPNGDTLTGGWGADFLKGETGMDTFVLDVPPNPGNADAIDDFYVPADTIALSLTAFPGLGAAGPLHWTKFHVNAPQAFDDRIIYVTATGELLFDTNGIGQGGSSLIATLSAGLLMTHADFVVL